MNRGTRIRFFIFLLANVCVAWWGGFIEFSGWSEYTQWLFGIYATSEVGSKGAEAYRDRS